MDVLLLGLDDDSRHRVETTMMAQVAKLQPEQQQFWLERLLFTNASVPELNSTAPSLVNLIQQWQTLRRDLTWSSANVGGCCTQHPDAGLMDTCNSGEWVHPSTGWIVSVLQHC